MSQPTFDTPSVAPSRPLREIKDDLRGDIKTLVGRLVGVAGRDYMRGVFDHKFAYQLLNHASGTTQASATEDQLNIRKEILKGFIELAALAEGTLSEGEWWEAARDARGRAA